MKKICEYIDFADADYISCEWKNGDLTVCIEAWDEKQIKIIFQDAIQFSYKLGDVISGVFQVSEKSDLLEEATNRCFVNVPEKNTFKHFIIRDIYDFPFFEIIANSVTANKEP
jgi:hypothetical protein